MSLNDQFIEAVLKSHYDDVDNLLAAGADVHYNDDDALQWAAKDGDSIMVKTLLDAGANPNAGSGNALRWAKRKKEYYTDVVDMLEPLTRTEFNFADKVMSVIKRNEGVAKNSGNWQILNVGSLEANGIGARTQKLSNRPHPNIIVVGDLPIAVSKTKSDYKQKYLMAIDLLSQQSGQDYSAYKQQFLQMVGGN